MSLQRIFFSAGCTLIVVSAHLAMAQDSCTSLKDLPLDHATVVSAKWVEAGSMEVPLGPPPKAQSIPVARHCEVTGVSRPTSDSEITFMLWLPAHEDWNGKYLQRGNGGWAGSIQQTVLIGPLAHGYAVSATDDGHRLTGINIDASWAVGHPEKLIDFGYRSLHETAALSKMIVLAYYRKTASRAYFQGCSDGGREALMEAERYPEDFDGIIAGAPANNWTHHFAGLLWNEMALESKPESRITADKLPAIEKAALAACDALDGVKDGLIEDPRQCHFDPSVLLCHGSATADCLSQPQIDALKKIYSGLKDPKTGEQIYPGFEPGTEAEPGTWVPWIVASPQLPISLQSGFANSLFSQAVFENPQWDWHTMDFARDVRIADEKTGWILNSYNPDLRTFRDHGGKLIQYHGWGDAAIAPRDSINFYEQVTQFLAHHPDPRYTNASDVHAFYRLFMVPGMGHCGGGPGPASFGNDEFETEQGIPFDADHNLLLALDRWVTQGVAPEKFIGTGRTALNSASGGVRLTRPLCVYPKVARYKGQGDTNAAENFECVQ
jgi:feruloyl esterase